MGVVRKLFSIVPRIESEDIPMDSLIVFGRNVYDSGKNGFYVVINSPFSRTTEYIDENTFSHRVGKCIDRCIWILYKSNLKRRMSWRILFNKTITPI